MKVLGHLLDSSNQRYVVYDKEQDAPTLQAAMGTGGGNVPYVTDRGGRESWLCVVETHRILRTVQVVIRIWSRDLKRILMGYATL